MTENSGGGLTLYVWDEDKLVYAHTGYEYTDPTQLRDDLRVLADGGDPIVDGWEGNDLEDEDIIRAVRGNNDIIRPLAEEEYYDDDDSTKIICEDGQIADEEEMGSAGHKIFYPSLD